MKLGSRVVYEGELLPGDVLKWSTPPGKFGWLRLTDGTRVLFEGPLSGNRSLSWTNEDGVTSVITAGPAFQVVAENEFDDYTLSSPAISGGRMFFRTTKFLWAIGSSH